MWGVLGGVFDVKERIDAPVEMCVAGSSCHRLQDSASAAWSDGLRHCACVSLPGLYICLGFVVGMLLMPASFRG
jgi:hypothetical protein